MTVSLAYSRLVAVPPATGTTSSPSWSAPAKSVNAIGIMTAALDTPDKTTDPYVEPTITDSSTGGRTWTLSGRCRTLRGNVWLFTWYNPSASSVTVTPTLNLDGSSGYGMGVSNVGLVFDNAYASAPTYNVVINPTGDSYSTTGVSQGQVTYTPTVGADAGIWFASAQGPIGDLVALGNTTTSTSAYWDDPDTFQGTAWRTSAAASTASTTIGMTGTAKANQFGNVLLEVIPAAPVGSTVSRTRTLVIG